MSKSGVLVTGLVIAEDSWSQKLGSRVDDKGDEEQLSV